MQFDYSDECRSWQDRLTAFMDAHILPRLADAAREDREGARILSFMPDLKQLAREEGLWNLFLPGLRDDEPGTGLSNLDYAPLAELMGRVPWASEVFNCSAPDTGNMELLHLFATPEQNRTWLQPLLAGEIRSAFAMTEPDVSSSDATNIQTLIRRDGEDYVIDGRKWFITNAAHPLCRLLIVMGKSDSDGPVHRQQSMVLVPLDTPGVTVERNISVLNHHSRAGHCEVTLRGVRVPVGNLLGEEGDGFAMAQARLGPGRIHHCMRSIGQAELALELMCARAGERRAFGKYLHEHGSVAEAIALSRIEIEQARLPVLKTAWLIDREGARAARNEISMIKALVPSMQARVTDRAIQVHGAMGLSPDTPLADLYTIARTMRIVDGPDAVHLGVVARREMKASEAGRPEIARYLAV